MGGQAAAANDSWRFSGHLEEERGVVGVENIGECRSIDKQHLLCVVVFKEPLSEYKLIVSSDFVDFLIDALQSCANGDAFGSFYLITGEHPYLDASHTQSLNSNRHLVLQLILNACNAHQIHFFLQLLHDFLGLNMPVLQ